MAVLFVGKGPLVHSRKLCTHGQPDLNSNITHTIV